MSVVSVDKLSTRILAPAVVATVHPSSILRAGDEALREEQLRHLVQDLKFVAEVAKALK